MQRERRRGMRRDLYIMNKKMWTGEEIVIVVGDLAIS